MNEATLLEFTNVQGCFSGSICDEGEASGDVSFRRYWTATCGHALEAALI